MATELAPLLIEAAPPSDPCDREAIATAFARLSDDDQELLALVGWDGLGPSGVARSWMPAAAPSGCGCTAPGSVSRDDERVEQVPDGQVLWALDATTVEFTVRPD